LGLVGNEAFSWRAKLRLLKEPFIRTTAAEDESVADFFERRLGKEIVDYAVDPFVSGIYAGDPRKLSIRHAFPRLVDLESQFGSLITGAMFSRKNKASKLPKGTPRSITFKKGMQTLTDKLYESLKGNLELGVDIANIAKNDRQQFEVRTDSGTQVFDAVVISTPADAAAQMLCGIDTELAQVLGDIYYAPIAVVFTGFKSEQVKFDPKGFGFLVPSVERRKILGSLWTSSVFENRVPKDSHRHLFTTFIGGSRNAGLVDAGDDKLIAVARDELDSILGVEGSPEFVTVKKWPRAIPQYNIGYEAVVEAIESFQGKTAGVFFCSNFYKGISVSDCVKNSVVTRKAVLDHLTL
jgi:oxygen-dependent protoporphyrinogen oxidase